MMTRPILLILLLPSLALAAFRTEYQDTIIISSLPYTMTHSDTAYCLSGFALTATNSGINNGGVDRVMLTGRIAGQKDTIKFASSGTGDEVGLFVGYQTSEMVIRNIVFRSLAPASVTDSTKQFYGARVRSSNRVWFDSCAFFVAGFNGVAVWFEYGYNMDLSYCYFISTTDAFRSRCNRNATLIRYIAGSDYGSGDYSFRMHGCKAENAPHAIVAIDGGSSEILIYDDTLTVDARNNAYSYPATSTCFSSANAFAIDLLGVGLGARIYNNIIGSGNTYEGGQGILVQAAVGTESDSVLIYGNKFNIHNGPNEIYGEGRGRGIYFRYVPGNSGTGSSYVGVRDNVFTGMFDTDTATTAIGRSVEVMSLIMSGGGVNIADVFHNITFERNRSQAIFSGIDTGWSYGTALGWGSLDSATYQVNRRNIVFKNNYFYASRAPISIGNMPNAGFPGNDLLMIGDTIDTDVSDSTIFFCQLGAYSNHSRHNRFRDCKFLNVALDTVRFSNVVYGSSDSLGLSVQFERTIREVVHDTLGNAISEAEATITNAYGQVVGTGLTDAQGAFEAVGIYKFKAKDLLIDSYILTDSLAYNPFTLKAKKGIDSVSVEFTVDRNNACDTLVLTHTSVTPSTGTRLMLRK